MYNNNVIKYKTNALIETVTVKILLVAELINNTNI